MPAWASSEQLRSFYAACPPGYEVDHIVPLKAMDGRKHIASGLHWTGNLQYLPASENRRKWAKMPKPEEAIAS